MREKTMRATWVTKWGPRRVKLELPTLDEAMIAAESMTDDPKQRIEIAASAMGLPVEEVRVKAGAAARRQLIMPTNTRGQPQRAVVVERKKVRKISRPAA